MDDYVKPKYGENAKHCYMETDSFIVHVKTDNVYKDIADSVETRYDTSNFEIEDHHHINGQKRIWTNERWTRCTNHEKIFGLRAKKYSYLKDNNDKDKKAKGSKKCVIKKT